MGFVHPAPTFEGVPVRELLHHRVGQDGKLLIGGGLVEEGHALISQGVSDHHGQVHRVLGDAGVKIVGEQRLELDAQQPSLRQHPALTLDHVAEILLQVRMEQHRRLPEQGPHLGAADVEGIDEPGDVPDGHVRSGGHQAVAQPRPVQIQI